MKKIFGFVAGAIAGTVVGAAASLVFTPKSGADLKAQASARWEAALTDARGEMERTQKKLTDDYQHLSG